MIVFWLAFGAQNLYEDLFDLEDPMDKYEFIMEYGSQAESVKDFDFQEYTVVIKNKVYVRPDGEDWIFYDSDQNAFRRPTFGELGGNEAMDQDEVEEKIADNVPVWIVDGDFGEFEL